MTSTQRRTTRKLHLNRPLCERLEMRIALSTVLGTDPGPGMILTTSPTTFRVTFDAPIDPFSLGTGDVLIGRVADDGSLSPILVDGQNPQETLNDEGTVLTLDAVNPIAPGRYRLVLAGTSGLAGLDGTTAANADGTDQTLADFTVERPGVGLSDAVDLGPIGADPVAVAGSLDFTANPSAVSLYKLTLPKGHFYRLGAEVSADRDGSRLDAALTLFDASGRAISTNDLGRPDAPNDPFLFAGVKPGTYYLGVSGAGDLPGLPGGYDLRARSPGPQQTVPGGAFTLHLVADVADLPGAQIGFSVQHADPLDPTLTGFTLRFSTPLDLGSSGSTVFDRATAGVDLVDQDGRSWPVAAVNYDARRAALAYLISDRLPQGRYTLRMNSRHPLVDLAGITPISPTMPKGVLANFAVGPDLRRRDPDGSLAIPASLLGGSARVASTDALATVQQAATASEDLGPLTPNLVLKGVSRTFTIEPGQTVALRFVALYDEYYTLGINHVGGHVQISVDGGSGKGYRVDPGPAGQENPNLAHFSIGQHVLRFTATGDAAVKITTKLGIGAFSWDSLLANGLGQGPALNLRLVANDAPANFAPGEGATATSLADAPSPALSSGPFAGPSAETFGASTAPAAHSGPSLAVASGGSSSVASRGSMGLAIDVGGALVGRPSADADRVAAVGPGTSSGAIAMASAATGPGQAIAAMGSLRGSFGASGQDPAHPLEPADPGPITDGSMPPVNRSEVPSPDLDESDLATTGVIPPALSTAGERGQAAPTATQNALLAPAAERSETEEAEAPAGITAWVVGLVGMTALGARWYQKRKRVASIPTVAIRVIPAPHKARTRVRV